jgi:hypothetical protein
MKRLHCIRPYHLVYSLILTVLLASCGSGGGSGTPPNSGGNSAPASAATLSLSYSSVKQFNFSWSDVSDATYYKLLENLDGVSGYSQIGGDINQGTQVFSITASLLQRGNASYILQSCNTYGCTDSSAVSVAASLAQAIGYFKSSNPDISDWFGQAISLSADGNTLAVAAPGEDSNATGIDGNQSDNSEDGSGAVYVFQQSNGSWIQQAYVKASNAQDGDNFGWQLDLSSDGNTLAVSAISEDSNATTINGDENDNSANNAGAVYIFSRNSGSWSQQAYIKASNGGSGDYFGYSLSLSADGNTLAVGASGEDSDAMGINGDPVNNDAISAGAAYTFTRTAGTWNQQAYIKASNTNTGDAFGKFLSLSGDANTLAISAVKERSNSTTINGNESDNSSFDTGAVYVFTQNTGNWTQQAYVKASNAEANDRFGLSLALSDNGDTLAVGAEFENSNATGVNGAENNNDASYSGAVYVFIRAIGSWSQQAYIKSSNSNQSDRFGNSLDLSSDGNTLAVSAFYEDSNSSGIGGDQSDNSADFAGAAYLFERNNSVWLQQAYIKASNTEPNDEYGRTLSLNGDGRSLAVGAILEDSNASGIGGDQTNNSVFDSGAVYLY